MITGLCTICGKPARFTCSLCGRLVCERHYVAGMCTECRVGKR
ncbi:hypothetical protein [Candidatus Pyrohabitans sp.]